MYKEMAEMAGSMEYNFHHNVLINSTTTFNQYYKEVGDLVNHKLEHGYGAEVIEYYKVKVWNLDLMQNAKIKLHNKGRIDFLGYRKYSTSITKSNIAINPIKVDKTCSNFATMDLETMNINGNQEPVAISACNGKSSKVFVIDHTLIHSSPDLAVNKLWKEYFDYLLKSGMDVIFAHNLGSFDGYFLYKALINHFYPVLVAALIDESKSFISISLNLGTLKIVFKDSLRIFPVSLDNLCQIFKVKGKLVKYDIRFNDLSLFTNSRLWGTFKSYALQDAVALYKALQVAQGIYFDYYKAYVTDAKYFDVNSLYSNAMTLKHNPMPLNLIKVHKNMDNLKLEDFFGYVKVEVICPKSVTRPMLPFKYQGKTIYPTGNWIATYFSEELKAVQMLGYQFRLIKGYEFSKANIFNSYVHHFFNIKLNSTGAQKAIAKLHLNGLYGYFGRRQDLIETVNVNNSSISKYLSSRIVKELLKINDNYSTFLLSANINHNVLRNLNMICESAT